VLHEYKVHNAQVIFRGDYGVDELIDVLEGNRKYLRCIYLYNKVDNISIEEVDQIARRKFSIPISCELAVGFEMLLKKIWDTLGLTRIYTKKRGCPPDFDDPIILSKHRGGTSIEDSLSQIHKVSILLFHI
jgi:uncharacterized protein